MSCLEAGDGNLSESSLAADGQAPMDPVKGGHKRKRISSKEGTSDGSKAIMCRGKRQARRKGLHHGQGCAEADGTHKVALRSQACVTHKVRVVQVKRKARRRPTSWLTMSNGRGSPKSKQQLTCSVPVNSKKL